MFVYRTKSWLHQRPFCVSLLFRYSYHNISMLEYKVISRRGHILLSLYFLFRAQLLCSSFVSPYSHSSLSLSLFILARERGTAAISYQDPEFSFSVNVVNMENCIHLLNKHSLFSVLLAGINHNLREVHLSVVLLCICLGLTQSLTTCFVPVSSF